MSFLAPLFLFLGAAAAVPVLLHFLRRRIATTVEFPAARYLARAEQEHSAKLRLRNWLLMALRVLAVLLVAFAAARPVARLAAGGHPPTAVALVLDNSLSTSAVVNGRAVLEELRAAALGALDGAATTDQLWLVTADGRVTGGSLSAIRDAVARVEPITGAGDLRVATERAAELARGARLASAAVVVITDAQATAWRTSADVANTRAILFAPPENRRLPSNRAVSAAAARPSRWSPAGAVVARVSTEDSAAYRVTLADATGVPRTAARGTAPPRGEVNVRVNPVERGWLTGTFAVEPDELRGDDVRYFAAFVGDAPGVRVDASAGQFVATAVAALADSRRVSAGGASPSATIAAANAGAPLPALLLAPNDPAALGAANQALQRAGVPWRFGAARVGESAVRFRDAAAVTRDSLAAAGGAPASVSLRYALVPRGGAASDTLATAGNEPWIVAGDGYVLVASPLVPEATTFPVRAVFVPWLGDVVAQRLGGAAGSITAAAPGATVTPPAGVDSLLHPNGRRTNVSVDGVTAPPQPGVYFWLRDGVRVGALEVNPEADESQLARLDARALRERFRGTAVSVADRADAVASLAWRGEGRRPAGGPLLAGALVAILAEGVATRRAARAARS